MAKKNLQLGRPVPIPASPGEAVLDRVRNPHPGTNYAARFAFPEFTAICPVTGQPDFATLVIDYVPKAWLVESKSLKLYLNSFRNHPAFHRIARSPSGKNWPRSFGPNGCASAAIFIRAAACRSMCFGRPENYRAASGSRIKAFPPIARADKAAGARSNAGPMLVGYAQLRLTIGRDKSGRGFHVRKNNRRSGVGGRARRSIAVAGSGGKAREGREEDDRCVRPIRGTLYFRLRSIQLVHDVYVHERSIDAGAVLAMFPAERSLSGAALLRENCPFGPSVPSARSS